MLSQDSSSLDTCSIVDLVVAPSAGEMERREIYPRASGSAFSLFFYGECLDDAGDVERPSFQGPGTRQPLLLRPLGGEEGGGFGSGEGDRLV